MTQHVETFSHQPHAKEDQAMGQLYRRKKRDGKDAPIWWIKYYINGKPIRESTGITKETEAKRFLKEREGMVAIGQPLIPRADRIPYETIATELKAHYEATGERDLVEAETRLKPLGKFFRGYKIAPLGMCRRNTIFFGGRKRGGRPGRLTVN